MVAPDRISTRPYPALIALLFFAVSPGASADAYTQALRLWATGSGSQAVEELARLQRDRALGTRRVEATVKYLVANQPEALVPVLGLHVAALAALSGRQGLSTHSRDARETLTLLVRRYAKADKSVEARDIAARCLIATACSLLNSPDGLQLAQEYLTRALERAPDNLAARHGQASLFEKLGRYDDAARELKRVLRDAPEKDDARLRLAIVDLRRGRKQQARKALANLAESDAPGWVRAVAFQELTQLQLQLGHELEAHETLRRGRKAFPHDEQLTLLHLWLLDDRSPESLTLIEQLSPQRPTSSETSPRTTYNLRPSDLDQALEAFARDVSLRLDLLAGALQAGNRE